MFSVAPCQQSRGLFHHPLHPWVQIVWLSSSRRSCKRNTSRLSSSKPRVSQGSGNLEIGCGAFLSGVPLKTIPATARVGGVFFWVFHLKPIPKHLPSLRCPNSGQRPSFLAPLSCQPFPLVAFQEAKGPSQRKRLALAGTCLSQVPSSPSPRALEVAGHFGMFRGLHGCRLRASSAGLRTAQHDFRCLEGSIKSKIPSFRCFTHPRTGRVQISKATHHESNPRLVSSEI